MAERCVQKKFLFFGTDLIAVDEIEFLALLIIESSERVTSTLLQCFSDAVFGMVTFLGQGGYVLFACAGLERNRSIR
jgi:hypothetical protein